VVGQRYFHSAQSNHSEGESDWDPPSFLVVNKEGMREREMKLYGHPRGS